MEKNGVERLIGVDCANRRDQPIYHAARSGPGQAENTRAMKTPSGDHDTVSIRCGGT